MYKKKKILAIIPARGGSKGIKNKNLIKINNKELFFYISKNLKKVGKIIDKKIVSTDNKKIIKNATKYNIQTPFLRPKHLSGDRVAIVNVLIHAVKAVEKIDKTIYDIILCMEPTCPLRNSDDIIKSIKKIIDEKLDTVWTISETDNKYHPDKQLVIKNNCLEFFTSKGKNIIARQQLSKIYHRNGALYAISRDMLLKNKKILGKKNGYIISKNYMTSIDTEFDIKYTEWIDKKINE